MTLSQKMVAAINDQIGNEFQSAYLYLSMAAWFESRNLKGFATWLRAQYAEEQAHALKLYDYLLDRGGAVALAVIPAPPREWKSNLAAFEEVLAHEQAVSALISKLYALAVSEQDYATQAALQWFITEQIEEEKNAGEIVAQIKMIDARETAVLMLDHQLGKRKG